MVVHGHFLVNGKKLTRPSALIDAGDVITIKDCEKSREHAKAGIAMSRSLRQPPSWVQVDDDTRVGTVVTLPKRDDVPIEINELFVVEFCSR
jgi:small subunit ribosomal protein S4